MIDSPAFLALDPTGLCNFRCTTCVLDRRYPEPVLMQDGVLAGLADTLPLLDGLAVGCDAEPTLHPRLPHILRHLRDRLRGELLVITNGSRLDPANATAMLDAGVDDLAVSLDGATRETFEAVRRRGAFDEVIAHLAWLADRARIEGRPRLRVIFTTLASNASELPDLVELVARLGIPTLSVNGFEPYSADQVDQRQWRRPGESLDLSFVRDAHERARERARQLGIELKLPELEVRRAHDCVFAAPVVGPAGWVSPCPALSYDRDVPLPVGPVSYRRRVYGRIPDESFLEIWRKPDYVAFRRQAAAGLEDPACEACLVASGSICARQ